MGADEQCAFLLRDREAKMDHDDYDMHTICQRMYCRSPTKTGDYRAGPALEGTRCSKTDNKVFSESNSISFIFRIVVSSNAHYILILSKGHIT